LWWVGDSFSRERERTCSLLNNNRLIVIVLMLLPTLIIYYFGSTKGQRFYFATMDTTYKTQIKRQSITYTCWRSIFLKVVWDIYTILTDMKTTILIPSTFLIEATWMQNNCSLPPLFFIKQHSSPRSYI